MRTPGVYFIRMKIASMHAYACRSSSTTRIYSCPDGVQKRYSNVVGMAVCPRDDFLLPPGQITRPLCAPRQASPSDNVLPVSVIPLRPPFARSREKPPDRIRPLPRISDYRRCRCNTRNIYRWPLTHQVRTSAFRRPGKNFRAVS